jgi:hypothetical protein
MAGFIRRFSTFPTLAELAAIEAINIVDLPPPAPTTGIATGTLLVVGEFEDGPFAVAGADAARYVNPGTTRILEALTAEDMRQKYGAFGFTYAGVRYSNPCARRHATENWNGNGFLHLKFCRAQKFVIARVDSSVGEVGFQALAAIDGAVGPYVLAPGQTISVTTQAGGPAASTAIAATAATVAGGPFAASGYLGGESIDLTVDALPTVRIVFSAADQTPAQVAARINAVMGFTVATAGVGVTFTGLQLGTGGRIVLADGSAGALASIAHVAGTTAGTGNVVNVLAVTAAEVAAIINATPALAAIFAAGQVTSDGRIRVLSTTAGTGTVLVAAGAMATALGLTPTATTVSAGVHGGGTIAAGTRVRTAGGAEWVTMQTLTIPAGTAAAPQGGPFVVRVRPALDDGTAAGTALATVNVVVDQPAFRPQAVNNAAALTAALTEAQLDVRYEQAFDATLDLTTPARLANFSASPRRSDPVVRKGRQNAIDASNGGHFGRKYLTRAPLGFTLSQAQADVALWRSDRVFYTWPGWRVRIPEIAERGAAGGIGFTADGVITIGAEFALATIDALLAPEEDPGQQTGLIEDFFQVEPQATTMGIAEYTALKAAGICGPRRDPDSGSIYQSGVTSDLTPGLTTQARRKMADFIQDTLAQRLKPYAKKLNSQSRRDSIRAVVEQFLSSLLSLQNPELARISGFEVDAVSGNTPDMEALGIFVLIVRVRTLSSLQAITIQTEIGEGVTITELAA